MNPNSLQTRIRVSKSRIHKMQTCQSPYIFNIIPSLLVTARDNVGPVGVWEVTELAQSGSVQSTQRLCTHCMEYSPAEEAVEPLHDKVCIAEIN